MGLSFVFKDKNAESVIFFATQSENEKFFATFYEIFRIVRPCGFSFSANDFRFAAGCVNAAKSRRKFFPGLKFIYKTAGAFRDLRDFPPLCRVKSIKLTFLYFFRKM